MEILKKDIGKYVFKVRGFKDYMQEFEESFEKEKLKLSLPETDIKLDWSKIYKPNFSCLWNKIANMEKPCIIFGESKKGYLVSFIKEFKEDSLIIEDLTNNEEEFLLICNFYRKEDLSLYEK